MGVQTGQLSDYFLRHAVAEVLFAWIAGEVFEREHCQHHPGRRWKRARPLPCAPLQWGNETIAAPCDGLDESGPFRRITQGFTKLADRRAKAMVEIDKGISRPEPTSEFLAGHQLGRAFKQCR